MVLRKPAWARDAQLAIPVNTMKPLSTAILLSALSAVLSGQQNLFKPNAWTGNGVSSLSVTSSRIKFTPYSAVGTGSMVGIQQIVDVPTSDLYRLEFTGWTPTNSTNFKVRIVFNGVFLIRDYKNTGFFHLSNTGKWGPRRIVFEFRTTQTSNPNESWELKLPTLTKVQGPHVDIVVESGGSSTLQQMELSGRAAAVAAGVPSPVGPIPVPGLPGHLRLDPSSMVILHLAATDQSWKAKPALTGLERYFLPANYVPIQFQALSTTKGFGDLMQL